MFLRVSDADGLWGKIRNHVGTTVKHPISPASRNLKARINDPGVKKSVSVCPYCAVGCSQLVYHRDGRIIDIEGNPDSPINAGTLCPKGSATFGLHVSPHRVTKVRYRRPYSSEWEDLSIDEAMDMIAARVKKARDENWEETNEEGKSSPARWRLPPSVAPPSTTRRTTSSPSSSTRWDWCASPTRREYDTPPRCPVWASRTVGAAPPPTCRTSRTPTASSSRARTWPRPIRSASGIP